MRTSSPLEARLLLVDVRSAASLKAGLVPNSREALKLALLLLSCVPRYLTVSASHPVFYPASLADTLKHQIPRTQFVAIVQGWHTMHPQTAALCQTFMAKPKGLVHRKHRVDAWQRRGAQHYSQNMHNLCQAHCACTAPDRGTSSCMLL